MFVCVTLFFPNDRYSIYFLYIIKRLKTEGIHEINFLNIKLGVGIINLFKNFNKIRRSPDFFVNLFSIRGSDLLVPRTIRSKYFLI